MANVQHKCAAKHCHAKVPLDLLMCSTHWSSLPAWIRNGVWANYRKGQEIGEQSISPRYGLFVARAVEYCEERHAELLMRFPDHGAKAS